MKISIIILNYLKAKKTVKNILSFLEQEVDFGFEIIVVDNSCDEKEKNIFLDFINNKLEKIFPNVKKFTEKKFLLHENSSSNLLTCAKIQKLPDDNYKNIDQKIYSASIKKNNFKNHNHCSQLKKEGRATRAPLFNKTKNLDKSQKNNQVNLKFIFNEKNTGYSKGNNLGVKNSQGKFLAIVNPDIYLEQKNVLQKILNFYQKNPDIGILGPKQIQYDSKKIEKTARAFPKLSTQIARRTWLKNIQGFRKKIALDEMKNLDYKKIQEVDWLQSSFIFLSKKLWDQVGGFNEKYFLFMADVEICKKSWQLQKKVIFYPKVSVMADGIRCSRGGFFSFFYKQILRHHVKDSLRYFFK